MFRYERPQKGRLRQFHQIDVEILGVATPHADIEVVALGAHILSELGVADRVELEINSLGDAASRAAYRDELVAYLRDHEGSLSEDSLTRLARNPLRVLDSKNEDDRRVVAGAPPMSASLNEASTAFYAAVCDGLDALDIQYRHNERLVRGLDYYTHTAFEFVTDALGAQGAVIAGGRYDRLIETMGGPPTPGIGWAGGIERLAMLADTAPPAPRPIAVVPVSADEEASASKLAHDLRHAGFTIELGYRGNLSRRLKRANKRKARVALLIGGDELARAMVTLRDLDSGDQSEVALAALPEHLALYR